MSNLGKLSDLYYIEVTRALGDRQLMTCEAYASMPLADLRHTSARMVSRTELIAKRAQARKAQASE